MLQTFQGVVTTLDTNHIQALDIPLEEGGPTLRYSIMGLNDPTSDDSDKRLFLAVDRWVTDPNKVTITFRVRDLHKAKEVAAALPLIMALHYGPAVYGKWFPAGMKTIMEDQFRWDPDTASYISASSARLNMIKTCRHHDETKGQRGQRRRQLGKGQG